MSIAEVDVRVLTANDVTVLERVESGVFDYPVQLDLAFDYLANPDNLLAVAIQEGLVIGVASGFAYIHPDKPLQLFINEVGVSSRWQRQGIGKRLIRALLEQGRTMGCTNAWVATEQPNVSARALFTATQGTEIEESVVVFQWKLTD